MATEAAFVSDGYDFTAVVARVPGIYPRVEMTYRPASPDEKYRFQKAAIETEKRAAVQAELVAKHVSEWSIGDKPTKEKAMKLQPALFEQIVAIITGYAGTAEEETDRKN